MKLFNSNKNKENLFTYKKRLNSLSKDEIIMNCYRLEEKSKLKNIAIIFLTILVSIWIIGTIAMSVGTPLVENQNSNSIQTK